MSSTYSLKLYTKSIRTGAVLSMKELGRVIVQPLAQVRSAANQEDAFAVTRCFEEAIKDLKDNGTPEWLESLMFGIRDFLSAAIGPDAMPVSDCVHDFYVELPRQENSRFKSFICFVKTYED